MYQVIQEIPSWEIQPHKVILNLASEDYQLIEKDFEKSCSVSLEIQIVDDLGPAKKLIPTLLLQEHLPVVTIDDDLHYPPNLISKVLDENKLFPNCIISGRAHKILFDDEGDILPYSEWHGETSAENGPSKELFPTGVGMVLYPQNSLHQDVLDTDTYKDNCFYNDDFWFYFQGRRAGTLVRRVPFAIELNYVTDSQVVALYHENRKRNEIYLNNLVKLYGNPLFM
jgi:hypothetical protein